MYLLRSLHIFGMAIISTDFKICADFFIPPEIGGLGVRPQI